MTFFNDELTFDLAGGEDLEDSADDAAYEYGGTEARVFLVDAHQRMFDNAKGMLVKNEETTNVWVFPKMFLDSIW